MWPNSIKHTSFAPCISILYTDLCFKFQPFIHRICDVVLATPSRFLMSVGREKAVKAQTGATRRFKTLSYSATWSLGSFETAFRRLFLNSQNVLVFFFKNVRMIFSLGILDVENFQAANLSWRTTRGQMASLLVDVFKTHLHSMKIDFLALMFMFKDLFHRFFMCFLRKTWLAWNQHHLFLWWDHWWCRSQEFKVAKM